MRFVRVLATTAVVASKLMFSDAIAQGEPDVQVVAAFRVPMGTEAYQSPPSASNWNWVQAFGGCSTVCGTGIRAVSYECQNMAAFSPDGTGFAAPEPEEQCLATVGVKPAGFTSSCSVYTGCGYDWIKPAVQQTPVAVEPNPIGRAGCGQIREQFDPICRRSDGTILSKSDYAFCQNDMPDYADVKAGAAGSLGYDRVTIQTNLCNSSDHDWKADPWPTDLTGFNSTCSSLATRVRSVTCVRRFDGSIQADSECDPVTRPESSQVQPIYDSCSYAWKTGAFGEWSSTCSTTAVQTRSVTCLRSNGDQVDDAECTLTRAGDRPAASNVQPNYESCTYSYSLGEWGAWSSSCDGNASRIRAITCMRSNGDALPSSECVDRGLAAPDTNETAARYDSCSYSWSLGDWSNWSSSCSATATRTRSVVCERSNNGGQAVEDGECLTAGSKPMSSETAPIYSGCTFSASYGQWSVCASGSQSRPVTCTRSDGVQVDPSACGFTNSTQTASCTSYAWNSGTYACQGQATQSRDVWCEANTGGSISRVADSYCTALAKPVSSNTQVCSIACAPAGSFCNLKTNGSSGSCKGEPDWELDSEPDGGFPDGIFPISVKAHSRSNASIAVTGVYAVSKLKVQCGQ